jgi:hypothetical protein
MSFGLFREIWRQGTAVHKEVAGSTPLGPGWEVYAGLASCFAPVKSPICKAAIKSFVTSFIKGEMKYLINNVLSIDPELRSLLNQSIDHVALAASAVGLLKSGGIYDIYKFYLLGGSYWNYFTNYVVHMKDVKWLRFGSQKTKGMNSPLFTDSIATFALVIQDDSGYTSTLGLVPDFPNQAVITAHSPVDIVVRDAQGRVGTKESSNIPYWIYSEADFDQDGDSEDVVIIGNCAEGELSIEVVPDSSATGDTTFSLIAEYMYNMLPETLAVNIPVSEIPGQPYSIEVFENLPSGTFAILAPNDTLFYDSMSIPFAWQGTSDPNPGHTVYYDLLIASDSLFNDTVVLYNLTDTTHLYSGTLPTDTIDNRFFWKVPAHDLWGEATTSNRLSFQVIPLCCTGIRGNADGDANDKINISDITYLVSYLFGTPSGPEPPCRPEGNADGDPDEKINILDISYLVNYLFGNPQGPAPPACP